MLSLTVEKRNVRKNNDFMRKGGVIPAVFYGKKQGSTPIVIKESELEKVWKAAGESTIVTLKEKEGAELDSLIHDVDFDPVTGKIRHVDFYVFEKGQKMEVAVPLEFVGVSPAIEDLGGILIKVLHELEIEAEPKNLPHSINVDISPLVTFESTILAKDLKLPEGVTLMIKPEDVVAAVSEPKEEEPDEPVEAPDLSAIEVEKKGKEETEGEEGATPDTTEAPAKSEGGKEAKK